MSPETLLAFIRSRAGDDGFVPLHAPEFGDIEKRLVMETIDSTFVSSVGQFVDQFEADLNAYTGSAHTIAVTNGTAGLHLALHALGIGPGDLVLTQSLSFIATCNAIQLTGARPGFVDVHEKTLGLDPAALDHWLSRETWRDSQGVLRSNSSNARVAAIVPMHTLGHPVDIVGILDVANAYELPVVEDAAESLGSWAGRHHTGTQGRLGVLSFNGNKILTTGGGGAVLCQDDAMAHRLKALSTTSKVPHPFRFQHSEFAFNYRLPNLNAALGCAQLTRLDERLAEKRTLAMAYKDLFRGSNFFFVEEPADSCSNYWLNAVVCPTPEHAEQWLDITNAAGIMTRPMWEPMHRSQVYKDCERGDLPVTDRMADCIVCLPSSSVLGREGRT
ncbi:LegC family aminotransferase [Saccharospirillum alexandrii]|uniref:LegC family aminotransferase n=1 Tax=Saccharospirillum alexandrii TaxID=2448477 RepID=UPI003735A4ED